MGIFEFLGQLFGAVKEYNDADVAEQEKQQRTMVIAIIAVIAAIILTLIFGPRLVQ